MKNLLYFLLIVNSLWQTACSVSKQTNQEAKQTILSDSNSIAAEAQKIILNDSNFLPAHVGISIYDPSINQYLYNYQGDKYFVPASNMKLFTCYAAMKNLGDSLVGLRYNISDDGLSIEIAGTGDPTFLHENFKNQRVFNFLISKQNISYQLDAIPQFSPLGRGWAWDDYEADYMAERSAFPIYGNTAKFFLQKDTIAIVPKMFYNSSIQWLNQVLRNGAKPQYRIVRPLESNSFYSLSTSSKTLFSVQYISFKTTQPESPVILNQPFVQLLQDTLHKKFGTWNYIHGGGRPNQILYSEPTDSLLKITMHRSDNFFAEQSLLMVSNERLGVMNDRAIIDTLLNTDFKNLPQKPKWVDGSGLSRYNLITPQDFVWVLNQMKNEFKWERITTILPTGNDGTLAGLYKNYVGKIYAKTGTLSNNVALSGYITTNKGKQLIFSILVNNHQTSASNIRRSIEKFLTETMEKN